MRDTYPIIGGNICNITISFIYWIRNKLIINLIQSMLWFLFFLFLVFARGIVGAKIRLYQAKIVAKRSFLILLLDTFSFFNFSSSGYISWECFLIKPLSLVAHKSSVNQNILVKLQALCSFDLFKFKIHLFSK